MTLSSGDRLGPYEVTGSLGAGGMGEVYRARDTRLQRDVAIKILPAAFANDGERIARFEREAHVLASLTHPNIAAIHGVEEGGGARALILELVEGETLAERIAQGPLPLDEALLVARQIAEALEAAHDKGIIHRDLKPANIKLAADGTVKVLDFGLAKMLEAPVRDSALSLSPTLTVHPTYAGVILGTAAYMSPEQARGKPIDRRTDVWAFGCVLFELLTGKQAFDPGETVSDAVAAVLTREPDWPALPAGTPPHVRALLRRCLRKDVRQRLPHIGVARLDLQEPPEPGVVVQAPARRVYLPWAIATMATISAVAFAAYALRASPTLPVIRSSILPTDGTNFAVATPATRFVLSPDGTRLAYLGTGSDNIRRIHIRTLDDVDGQALQGTEYAVLLTWSPDSREIAFSADQKLKKIAAAGGPTTTLAEPMSNNALTWSSGGIILFSPTARSPLHRVSASGGAATAATRLDEKAGDAGHWFASFLPDGRHFLYMAIGSPGGAVEARGIYVSELDSAGPPKLLIAGGSNARFADGYLLFLRDTTLMAQRFDPDRLQLSGAAEPVVEGVQIGGTSGRTGAFSLSNTGLLMYQTGTSVSDTQLTWVDHGGKVLGTLGEPADHFGVELSRDGSRVLTTILDPARRRRDVWVYDVRRGLRTRLTFDPADELTAVWSPDGTEVAFNSLRPQYFSLFRKAASGAGSETAFAAAEPMDRYPTSWSSDGRFLLYETGFAQRDIWAVSATGADPPRAILRTEFSERTPIASPDGRWFAYSSNESGRFEVYVGSFPSMTGKWQVSENGGQWPRWRPDGKELYYVSGDNRLMAAQVQTTADAFGVGSVTRLFDAPIRIGTYGGQTTFAYDVARDGRLLLNLRKEDTQLDPITLVTNWRALLKE